MALTDLVLSYHKAPGKLRNLLWVTELGTNVIEMVLKILILGTQTLYLNSMELRYLLACSAERWVRDMLNRETRVPID